MPDFVNPMASTMINLANASVAQPMAQAHLATEQAQAQNISAEAMLNQMKVRQMQGMLDMMQQINAGTFQGGVAGSPAGGVTNPVDTGDLVGQNQAAANDLMARSARSYQIGSLLAAYNPQLGDAFLRTATEQMNSAQRYMDNVNNLKKEKLERAGGILTSIKDPTTAEFALRRLAADSPELLSTLPIRTNPDGSLSMTPDDIARLQTAGQSFIKGSENLQHQDRVSRLAHDQQVLAETTARDQENAAHHQADEAIQRQGNYLRGLSIQEQRARTQAILKGLDIRVDQTFNRVTGQVRGAEDKAQAELDKDPAIKTFTDFQDAYQNAMAINPAKIDSTQSDVLAVQWQRAYTNFKSGAMSGGAMSKATEKQIDELSSVFDHWNTYLSTIGKGKSIPPATAQLIQKSMQDMYDMQNQIAVQRTLTQRAKVYERNGNPTQVTSPASIARVLQSNPKAQIVTIVNPDDNKPLKVLRLGPNQEDAFPIYDRPKPMKRGRSGLPLMALPNDMEDQSE